MYWNSVFDFRKSLTLDHGKSVKELICRMEKMNFKHLYYQKKLCFLHKMLRWDNSIVASVCHEICYTL